MDKFKINYKEPKPIENGLVKTDLFNKDPLFAVNSKNNLKSYKVVKSWNEAYALHEDLKYSDINPRFLALLINGENSSDVSPYKRIIRFPRSTFFLIKNGQICQNFKESPLRGIGQKIPYEILANQIKTSFIKSIKDSISDETQNICCEQSSGLDSNTIIGILIKSIKIPPNQLLTWSLEVPSEVKLIREFRNHFKLNPNNYLKPNKDAYNFENRESKRVSIIKSLGAPLLIDSESFPYKKLKDFGCKIFFSGLGGDQGLSHSGINVQNDLAQQGRLIELFKWHENYFYSFKTILRNLYSFFRPNWYESRINNQHKLNLLNRFLTEKGKILIDKYPSKKIYWEFDRYSNINHSIRHRITADWVSIRAEEEFRLAEKYGIRKIFPFLNEEIVNILINQDCLYLSNNKNNGRRIMRTSFSDFLPEFLINNPSKLRPYDRSKLLKKIEEKNKKLLEKYIISSYSWNDHLKELWDLEALRTECRISLLKDYDLEIIIDIRTYLERMCSISEWFNILDN